MTKGFEPGLDSLDDRVYLRFTVGTPEHTSLNACGERL